MSHNRDLSAAAAQIGFQNSNIGIGTDNPIMRLHVHGVANSADSRIRLSSIEGSGLTIRAQSATENNINADSGEDITFSRGNVESLRITSAGLVGIGSQTPGVKLDVQMPGSSSRQNLARFRHEGQTDLVIQGQWGNQDIGSANGTLLYNSSQTLALRSGSSGNAHVVLRNTGNIGIGTDNPNRLLHLKKSNGGGMLTIERTDSNSSALVIAADPSEIALFARDSDTGSTAVPFVIKQGGSTEALRITSAGRMGVGTNNPAGKLHISSGDSGDCVMIIEADTDNNNEGDNPKILFRQDGGNDWSAIGNGINNNGGAGNNALVLANSVGDANGGIIFQTGSSDGYTTASERLRITQAGEVQISNGNLKFSTSGTGIDFSATSNSSGTMSSELLDDYEEGSWTPNFKFTGGNTGITFSHQVGLYTRVGRLVTCYCIIILSNKGSSTGNAYVQGLPYTATDLLAGSSLEGGGHAIYQDNTVGTHVGPIQAAVINNQAYFDLYRVTSTNPGHSGSVTNGNVANNSSYRFVLQYTAV